MRGERGTLDGLSEADFHRAVCDAVACLDYAGAATTAALRASFGL
jgi:hypothetical protein